MTTKEFINLKKVLIDIFMLNMSSDIVDISFDCQEKNLILQIVLIEGAIMQNCYKEAIQKKLKNYMIKIELIHISKDVFNKSNDEWLPSRYKWLSNILYSKAEVL